MSETTSLPPKGEPEREEQVGDERVVIDRAVCEARRPDGRLRFYPPGRHPAYAHTQSVLEKLRDIESRTVFPTTDLEAAIDYCEQQIAMVEHGQRRDLQAFVEVLRHRLREPVDAA